MNAKRVLFYLEPVTYVNSPLRLGGWWNFFSAFARRSADHFISHVAAAPSICALDSDAFANVHPINQIDLLKTSNFDRPAYSRDLCRGFSYKNRPLLKVLQEIKRSLSPDIVISVTDNRYLQKVFGPDRVMFMELGPLPRANMNLSVYVDPYGHQINSAVDRFAKTNWSHPAFADFADIWLRKWVEPVQQKAESSGLKSWLDGVPANKKIMLAALQPSDWITYEGISSAPDPISVLRQLAANTSAEWVILPQWHSSDAVPSEDLVEELSHLQPNILRVPTDFRIAQSELLLPFIDAITTISSNVAATGAILGKPLNILGQSKFKRFSKSSREGHARIDFLAFLSNRYCRSLDDFLNLDGAFAEHILRLRQHPSWLLDPAGLDPSILESFCNSASAI